MPGARSALRVDQRRLSSTFSAGAFIQRTVFKLPFLLFHCLFVFPAADSVQVRSLPAVNLSGARTEHRRLLSPPSDLPSKSFG